MADSGTRTVKVTFVGDAKQFQQALKDMQGSSDSFASKITGTLGDVAKGFAVFGLAANGVQTLGNALGGLVSAAGESQRVQAQTEAVIQSTGQAAGLSAQQVGDMATAMSQVAPFDDEVIQSAENILLTFTKIGSDVMPTATKTVLDMSTALGEDTKDAAIQLGKALQDPVQGVTALQRVGVQLTNQQKDQIAAMVKVGDTAGAQAVILQELQKEFGGSAEAAGKTFGGQLTILKTQLGNIEESLGTVILNGVTPFIGSVTSLAERIANFVQGDQFAGWVANLQALFSLVGQGLAELGGVFDGQLKGILSTVTTVGKDIYTALQWINPFARHSPSLVDQVNDGVNAILAKYGQLPQIGGPLSQAAAAVQAFTQAVSQGMADAAAQQEASTEDALKVWGDNVPAAYQKATAALGDLNGQLDGLNGQIAQQQDVVDGYQGQIKQTEQAIKDQTRALDDQQQTLVPYKQAVDDASAALKAQEQVVKDAENALKPYQQAVTDAQQALKDQQAVVAQAEAGLKPYQQAVTDAEQAVKDQQRALDEAAKSLKPYEDAVRAADDAVREQEQVVKAAQDALKPYDEALKSAQDALKAEQQATSDTKDEISNLKQSYDDARRSLEDLSHAQLQGSEAYSDQLFAIQQQQAQVQLQITNLKLGPQTDASKAQIDALQAQLDQLGLQADKVRLTEQVDLGPKQHQLEAMAQTSKEVSYDDAVAGIEAAKQKMAALDPQIAATTAKLTQQQQAEQAGAQVVADAQAARDKANTSLQAQQDKLAKLKDSQDAAKQSLDDQKQALQDLTDKTLGPLNDALQAAKDALDAQQQSVDKLKDTLAPYQAALDAATQSYDDHKAAVDKLKDSLDPLQQQLDNATQTYNDHKQALDDLRTKTLQPLQDKLADLQGSYDTENQKLSDLKGKYQDIAAQVKQWQQNLDDAVKSAEAASKAAEGSTPGGAKTNGPMQPVADFGLVPGGASGSVDQTAQKTSSLREKLDDVTAAVGRFWDKLSPVVDQIEQRVSPVVDRWRDSLSKTGDILQQKAGPLLDQFRDTLSSLEPILKPLAIAIAALNYGPLLVMADLYANLLPGAIQTTIGILEVIMGTIKTVADVFTGTKQVIADLIHGDWSKAWSDAKATVQTTVDDIGTILHGCKDTVVGIVKGLYDGVVGFFQDLYDTLVGHSIIPDLVNKITDLITGLRDDLKRIWDEITTKATDAWDSIHDHVRDTGQAMEDVLSAPFKWFRDLFDWSGLTNAATDAWDAIRKYFEKPDLVASMTKALSAPFRAFAGGVGDIVKGGARGIVDVFNNVLMGISAFVGTVVAAVNWISQKVANKDILPNDFKFTPIDASAFAAGGGGASNSSGAGGSGGPMMARGGVVDRLQPNTTLGEDAARGFEEYVIPTAPEHRQRAMGLLGKAAGRLGIPYGTGGGIMDSIGGIVSDVRSAGSSALSGIGSLIAQGGGALTDAAFSAAGVTGSLPGIFGQIGSALVGTVKTMVASFAQSLLGSLGGLFGGGGSGWSGIQQWSDLILKAADATGVPWWAIAAIMRIESGGDPTAVSPQGAEGLMQVMPYWFAGGENGMDPWTNILKGASILGNNYKRWGTWDQAAAAYFGAIDAQGNITGASDATGQTGGGYVAKFDQYISELQAMGSLTPAGGGGGASAYGFIKPIDGTFTQGFYGSGSHSRESAIDWMAPRGSKVWAPMAGVLAKFGIGLDGDSGPTAVIDHPGGWETRYGHLSALLASVGSQLAQGQVFALSGDPAIDGGYGNGAHLHMALLRNGSYVTGQASDYFPLASGGWFAANNPVLGLIGEGNQDEIVSPVPAMQDAMRTVMNAPDTVTLLTDAARSAQLAPDAVVTNATADLMKQELTALSLAEDSVRVVQKAALAAIQAAQDALQAALAHAQDVVSSATQAVADTATQAASVIGDAVSNPPSAVDPDLFAQSFAQGIAAAAQSLPPGTVIPAAGAGGSSPAPWYMGPNAQVPTFGSGVPAVQNVGLVPNIPITPPPDTLTLPIIAQAPLIIQAGDLVQKVGDLIVRQQGQALSLELLG